jgi:hypothetical protein
VSGITCLRIAFVDTEFEARKGRGEIPGFPLVICAVEVFSDGRVIEHRLAAPFPTRPPWDRGDPFLTVVFSGGAEAGSFMHVNWPIPKPTIDLYAEYMVNHNSEMVRAAGNSGEGGKPPGPSLINACKRYRVVGMDKVYKEETRTRIFTQEVHTPEDITDYQDYCIEDCRMTMRLFCAMRPRIDLLRAPLRAAFMMDLERMRWRGYPVDMLFYRRAIPHTAAIASEMRAALNRKLGAEVFYCDVFKKATLFRVMQWHTIPIPFDPKTGKPSCALKLIKPMVEAYPLLKVYYKDKRMIDAMRSLGKLEIGADGRNRFFWNPFGTKTGRNNPSTNRSLFGLPHTMRSFLKPGPGMALAQVDYGNQEAGIAAFLSKDPQAIQDYLSGDLYRSFAEDALGISSPTKEQRQVYKACVLGRLFGLGAASLARNLGLTRGQAERIMDQMSARYPVLNAWLERVTTKAAHCIPITCALGWSLSNRKAWRRAHVHELPDARQWR